MYTAIRVRKRISRAKQWKRLIHHNLFSADRNDNNTQKPTLLTWRSYNRLTAVNFMPEWIFARNVTGTIQKWRSRPSAKLNLGTEVCLASCKCVCIWTQTVYCKPPIDRRAYPFSLRASRSRLRESTDDILDAAFGRDSGLGLGLGTLWSVRW